MACLLLTVLLAYSFEFTPFADLTPGFTAAPLDDAWVHFVYARNALHSGILHYNPGQPAAGTTSLLWVLLLSLPTALGVYPPVAAKALGLLAQLGLALAVYLFLLRNTARPFAIIGALLICADPVNSFASLSGMEVTLYAALAFGAAAALMAGKLRLAGCLAALTIIARPDGALMILLIAAAGLAYALFALPKKSGRNAAVGRSAFWLILPPLLAALIWGYLNWRATGRWLPASFYVRAGGFDTFLTFPHLRKIFTSFAEAGSFIGHPLQWMLYALGLLWIAWRRDVRYFVLLLFPWLLAVLLGSDKLQVIGGSFLGNRYIVPGLPFLLVTQLLGAAFVADLLREKRIWHRSYRRYLPMIAALGALILMIGDPRVFAHHHHKLTQEYAKGCANIEQMQVHIGKWLAQNTPPEAVVGTFDAGAIAYFSQRETVDIMGLNTPHTPALSPQTVAKLDYLVTFPALSEGVEAPYREAEVLRVNLPYATVSADKLMVVYRVNFTAPTGKGLTLPIVPE